MFNTAVTERLKDDNFRLIEGEAISYDNIDDVSENDNLGYLEPNVQNMKDAVERNDYPDDAYDILLSAELLQPNESADSFIRGTVIKRAKNNLVQPIGTRHADANLDFRRHIVKMSDGMERELQHNLISTNMITQADSEGRRFLLLDEILNYRKLDSAVKKKDATHVRHNGNSHRLKTTKGYEFLVLWKDGNTDWIPLKDMYASNPLETTEFAVACQLQDKPAFAWWASNILKTKNRIINKIKSRYWKQEYKFDILLPKNVEDSIRIETLNDNYFWRHAIEKELKTVYVAYKPYEHNWENISPEQIRAER